MAQNLRAAKIWTIVVCGLLSLILGALFFSIPQTASEEYRYTVEVLFKYVAIPAAVLFGCLILYAPVSAIINSRRYLWLLAAGLVCGLIPALSPNIYTLYWGWSILFSLLWIVCGLCLGLFCFSLTARINNVFGSLFSLLGALLLVFALAEIYFILTPQRADGKFVDPAGSKYAGANFANKEFPAGQNGAPPYPPFRSEASRENRYDRTLYDVRYTYDKYDRRVVPAYAERPAADLLLFGGSFTFGYGLEDEQTWAWKLARDLGSAWRVTNYGQNAFGAQQMLYILEKREIAPIPDAPEREALFLAIKHHIIRPTGLFYHARKSYRYDLVDGKLTKLMKSVDSPLYIVPSLPYKFNGSQTVRELSDRFVGVYLRRNEEKLLKIYAAIIAQSSRLLAEEYGTRLTVLLWPDIEDLAPLLRAEDVPVIFAREGFKEWGAEGEVYQIDPASEVHPNDKATSELAAFVATYYKNLLREKAASMPR